MALSSAFYIKIFSILHTVVPRSKLCKFSSLTYNKLKNSHSQRYFFEEEKENKRCVRNKNSKQCKITSSTIKIPSIKDEQVKVNNNTIFSFSHWKIHEDYLVNEKYYFYEW